MKYLQAFRLQIDLRFHLNRKYICTVTDNEINFCCTALGSPIIALNALTCYQLLKNILLGQRTFEFFKIMLIYDRRVIEIPLNQIVVHEA